LRSAASVDLSRCSGEALPAGWVPRGQRGWGSFSGASQRAAAPPGIRVEGDQARSSQHGAWGAEGRWPERAERHPLPPRLRRAMRRPTRSATVLRSNLRDQPMAEGGCQEEAHGRGAWGRQLGQCRNDRLW